MVTAYFLQMILRFYIYQRTLSTVHIKGKRTVVKNKRKQGKGAFLFFLSGPQFLPSARPSDVLF